jgi:hypothetical protein
MAVKTRELMARLGRGVPTFGLAVLMATGYGNADHHGSLRKVWDYHVREIAGPGNSETPLGIFALGFSRNGQRIVAVVGRSSSEESVLVIDSRNPYSNTGRLAINPELWEQEPGAGNRRIEWSLSDQHVILAGRIVNISDGGGCALPSGVFAAKFSGPNQVVAYQLKPSRISFFDLECRPVSGWALPDGEFVEALDASAERGLVFVTQHKLAHAHITEVVDAVIDVASRKVLRQLPTWREATASVQIPPNYLFPKFAESGRTFCGMRGDTWHRVVVCSEVDTERSLNTTESWNDPDVRTALRAPRIVISDYSKKLDFIDFFWYPGLARQRIVWDYRIGKELVRWKPKMQDAFIQVSPLVHPSNPKSYPYSFDISPDGEYIVEGGAGIVSLYRIEL